MGGEFVPLFQLHPCFSSTLALCVGMEGVVEGRREKNGERDGRKGEQKEGRGKSSGDSLPSLIPPSIFFPPPPLFLPLAPCLSSLLSHFLYSLFILLFAFHYTTSNFGRPCTQFHLMCIIPGYYAFLDIPKTSLTIEGNTGQEWRLLLSLPSPWFT